MFRIFPNGAREKNVYKGISERISLDGEAGRENSGRVNDQ
jgi:hypothetical protein